MEDCRQQLEFCLEDSKALRERNEILVREVERVTAGRNDWFEASNMNLRRAERAEIERDEWIQAYQDIGTKHIALVKTLRALYGHANMPERLRGFSIWKPDFGIAPEKFRKISSTGSNPPPDQL